MPTTVVHVFHDDADSLVTGSRVAQRIHEVAADHGLTLEVFCFGPAQRRLAGSATEAEVQFNRQIDELIAAGVRVGACVNSARSDGTESQLAERGFHLEVARDAFVRFTVAGATVVSF